MKLSTLIEVLQATLEEYGDNEVCIYTNTVGYNFQEIMVLPDTLAKPGENIITLESKIEEKE